MATPPKASDYAHLPQTGGAGVYVVLNDSLPGLVKIGKSRALTHRIAGLSDSSVPTRFIAAAVIEVPDGVEHKLEGRIHAALSDLRVSANREFFRCDDADQLAEIIAVAQRARDELNLAERIPRDRTAPTRLDPVLDLRRIELCVRALRSNGKQYEKSLGNGLTVVVSASTHLKTWFYLYKIGRKNKRVKLGCWPYTTAKAAYEAMVMIRSEVKSKKSSTPTAAVDAKHMHGRAA